MSTRSITRRFGVSVAGLALVSGLLTGVTAPTATATTDTSTTATEATDTATTDTAATESTDAQVVDTEGSGTGLWVVQLDEPSLAAYTGGTEDLAPTSPQVTGVDQLDVSTSASTAYLDHLSQRQDSLVDDITDSLDRQVEVEYRYRTVLNAVAVEIDEDEAEQLADVPGVKAVYRDVERELQTDVSHDLIRAPAIWDGETAGDAGTRGEGTVVGIIDSGVNPFHPSFAATDAEGYTHTNPYGSGNYVGVCDPDHPEHEDICNDKLIGAWNFHPTAPDAQDDNNHGSHTASTAAGNVHEATFSIGDDEFTRTIQGVAPRANVISYLVCSPLCPTTSSIAAVEQAINDGVDVLNFSIGGSAEPWADMVDLAFLEAYNAGIFVSASAGNSGPSASTTAHVGPWNAGVAATTTNRGFVNTLDVTGPEPVTDDLTGLPIVPGEDVILDTDLDAPIFDAGAVDPGNADACASFPDAAFDGAVALIDRGTCGFLQKVQAAEAAGAVAVVVVNTIGGLPTVMGGVNVADIPSVMIERDTGQAVRDYLTAHADAAPTVHLSSSTSIAVDDSWEDMVAGFSSRGPAPYDVATPSIAAPGVNILAAGAAEGSDPNQYETLNGTSMASPHIAGSGALLTALHPDWSPAQIHSALTTTATTDGIVQEDGETPAGPDDIGAGRVDLAQAGRAGLTLDESHADFLAADPNAGGDPSTLNVPFAIDDACEGTCTFTRTVENVADVDATYTADVTSPDGLTVTAEPAEFTLASGATQSVEITVEVDDPTNADGTTVHGDVRFTTDTTHANGQPIATAHLPLVITPVAVRPAIDVTPGSLAADLGADDSTTQPLTVTNTGNAELSWGVYSDTAARIPRGPATTVDTVDPPTARSGAGLTKRDGAESDDTAEAVLPEPALPDDTDDLGQTISHSQSQAIVSGNSVACGPDDGVTTDANSYLRTFTLADFGIEGDLDVTSVEFGIESITAAADLTVTLYTMIDPEAELTYDNLEQLGTSTETFDPQDQTLATVPVTGTAPAGSTLVVEVSAPDLSGAAAFYPGSNGAGQSAPSYLASPSCGYPEPTDVSAIGFPDMHLVMNVTGRSEALVCAAPADTSWLDVDPTSGTVAGGEAQDVAVTVDTTGLDFGEYTASLCLQNNDPRRELVVVPVTLTVADQPVIELRPGELEISQDSGTTTSHPVTVANSGAASLSWSATAAPEACGDEDGVPWLAPDPAEGTVEPGGTADLAVTADASLLDAGTYTAALCFTSNDPHNAEVIVPVTLTVDPHEDPHVPAHTELDVPGLADDQAGSAVAIDGDTAVVGAYLADIDGTANQGAAYVYARTDDGWTRQETLIAEDGGIGTLFGSSVAVDDDTMVIGALGARVDGERQATAYVYVRDGDAWHLQDRLSIDESRPGNFGDAVAIDGDSIVVGAPSLHVGDNNVQGAAYAFTRSDGQWSDGQQLLASDGSSFSSFGSAIAVDGTRAVITAPATTVTDFREGAAYVFEYGDNGWTEQAILTDPDGAWRDEMGTSVDLAGDTVLIGAATADIGGVTDQGAAYVFGRDGGTWSERARLTVPGTAEDNFGASVALTDDTAVVGTSHDGDQAGVDLDQGAAYVFSGSGATWSREITLTASDAMPGDLLGSAVAADGSDVVVGAPGATVGDRDGQGTAYVFTPSEAAPAPPQLTVTADGLNPTLESDGTTTGTLTLRNDGEEDLNWEIGENSDTSASTTGLVRPSTPSTTVETTETPDEAEVSDGAGPSSSWRTSSSEDPASTDVALPTDEESTTLTHSASMDIAMPNTVACSSNEDGTTRQNHGLRTFTLEDFGVDGDFEVSEFTFGLENLTVEADLTVNLYTLDGPLEFLNLTRLASETVTLEPQETSLITVPITAQVPAGSTLVAEVVTPDLNGTGKAFLGSNDAGETAPSYIASEPCGTAEPATYESLGVDNVHLVMAVSGQSVDPISCALPDWLASDPTSGTVAPGENATVDVAFDANGLQPGEHTAHLCVNSNDPATPTVTVPATMTVTDEFALTTEARLHRGRWHVDLAWTGSPADTVDVYRDDERVATPTSGDDGTGSFTDVLGRGQWDDTVTYQVCTAGSDPSATDGTCTDPVTVRLYPRGGSH